MASRKEFHLTFQRSASPHRTWSASRSRAGAGATAEEGPSGPAASLASGDGAGRSQRRPGTALGAHSSAKTTAERFGMAYRSCSPQSLGAERSLPALKLLEGDLAEEEEQDNGIDRYCCQCGGWRAGCTAQSFTESVSGRGNDGPIAMPFLSIPSVHMDFLPKCTSQDELEAELAKRVGMALSSKANGSAAAAPAPPQQPAAGVPLAGALLAVLSDQSLMGQVVEELNKQGKASRLAAGLGALHAELGRPPSPSADGRDQEGAEAADLLSSELQGALGTRLKDLIFTSATLEEEACGVGSGPPGGKVGEKAVLQLWRKLQQLGWLVKQEHRDSPLHNRKTSRTVRMVQDISSGLDAQLQRNKANMETTDRLQEQLREARQKAHSYEDRLSRTLQDADKLRQIVRNRTERAEELEAELARNDMARFGDMAADLGAMREALGEALANIQRLGEQNVQLKQTAAQAEAQRAQAESQAACARQQTRDLAEERRELLVFQERAANMVREMEVSALRGRIQDLERSRAHRGLTSIAEGSLAEATSGPVTPRIIVGGTPPDCQETVEQGGGRQEATGSSDEVDHSLSSSETNETSPSERASSAGESDIAVIEDTSTGLDYGPAGAEQPVTEPTAADSSLRQSSPSPTRHRATLADRISPSGQQSPVAHVLAGRPASAMISQPSGHLPSHQDNNRLQLSTSFGSPSHRLTREASMGSLTYSPAAPGLFAECSAPLLSRASSTRAASPSAYYHHRPPSALPSDSGAPVQRGTEPSWVPLHVPRGAYWRDGAGHGRPPQRATSARSGARRYPGGRYAEASRAATSAREKLAGLVDFHNSAQISGSKGAAAWGRTTAAVDGLSVTGLRHGRTDGGAITCVRNTGKVVVVHETKVVATKSSTIR